MSFKDRCVYRELFCLRNGPRNALYYGWDVSTKVENFSNKFCLDIFSNHNNSSSEKNCNVLPIFYINKIEDNQDVTSMTNERKGGTCKNKIKFLKLWHKRKKSIQFLWCLEENLTSCSF